MESTALLACVGADVAMREKERRLSLEEAKGMTFFICRRNAVCQRPATFTVRADAGIFAGGPSVIEAVQAFAPLDGVSGYILLNG